MLAAPCRWTVPSRPPRAIGRLALHLVLAVAVLLLPSLPPGAYASPQLVGYAPFYTHTFQWDGLEAYDGRSSAHDQVDGPVFGTPNIGRYHISVIPKVKGLTRMARQDVLSFSIRQTAAAQGSMWDIARHTLLEFAFFFPAAVDHAHREHVTDPHILPLLQALDAPVQLFWFYIRQHFRDETGWSLIIRVRFYIQEAYLRSFSVLHPALLGGMPEEDGEGAGDDDEEHDSVGSIENFEDSHHLHFLHALPEQHQGLEDSRALLLRSTSTSTLPISIPGRGSLQGGAHALARARPHSRSQSMAHSLLSEGSSSISPGMRTSVSSALLRRPLVLKRGRSVAAQKLGPALHQDHELFAQTADLRVVGGSRVTGTAFDLPCHRNVMALESEYFREAVLHAPPSPGRPLEVAVKVSRNAVAQFIRFVYTSTVSHLLADQVDLLDAAVTFAHRDLQETLLQVIFDALEPVDLPAFASRLCATAFAHDSVVPLALRKRLGDYLALKRETLPARQHRALVAQLQNCLFQFFVPSPGRTSIIS